MTSNPIYFVLDANDNWESISIRPELEADFKKLHSQAVHEGKKGITRADWYKHIYPELQPKHSWKQFYDLFGGGSDNNKESEPKPAFSSTIVPPSE